MNDRAKYLAVDEEKNNIETYDYGQYTTVKLLHVSTGEIEELGLDQYLYGVVSSEMPANFEEEALEAIAKKAIERKTGARGLRAIVEGILLDLMYRVPSDESVIACTITKDSVEEEKEPMIEKNIA